MDQNLLLLHCIFYVKNLKVKQVVHHKKVFPSNKNSYLKKTFEMLSSYIFRLWGNMYDEIISELSFKNEILSEGNTFSVINLLFYFIYFNFFLTEKIQYRMRHCSLNHCWYKVGHCIHSLFPPWLYFRKQEAQWLLSTSEFWYLQTITYLPFAFTV